MSYGTVTVDGTKHDSDMQDRNQAGSVTCGVASMEMISVRSRDSVIDIAHNLRTKGLCNTIL